MEKRSKIEAVDGEIMLPEPLIQHIQSFLTGKEAAQTTVLSKQWYKAWLTRPNLELDQRNYRIGRFLDRIGFYRFAAKTMERYEQLNLKIESLKLYINDFYLAKVFVVKAMEMSAVDLNFETSLTPFILPNEVLESQNLITLNVTGCLIDGKTATWSSLESLTLWKVVIEGDTICDIIKSCPLLEQLLVSECKSQNPHSATLSTRMLAMNQTLINTHEFRKLKFLLLDKVKISSLFFSNFSFRFPFLKYLLVHHCFGKDIQIHSPSLEYISFVHKNILRAKFDVPRIHIFKFLGSHVPSLRFERASSCEWKSDIDITCARFRTSWFIKLNKFLRELRRSQSKISLSLVIGCMLNLEEGFRFPEDGALMDGLFWCFHPKCVYQCWIPRDKGNNGLLELLCKTLIEEGSDENDCCIIPNRGLHDLEQASIDVLEDSDGGLIFQPLSWKMLLDASVSPENKRLIRFELQWGLHSSTIQ